MNNYQDDLIGMFLVKPQLLDLTILKPSYFDKKPVSYTHLYLKKRKLQELLSTKITTGSVDLNIKKRKKRKRK